MLLPWSETKRIYAASKVNAVILNEANGIYGLTSILDSFAFSLPMVVTKTKHMSVKVEKEGYGTEVPAGSSKALAEAVVKLLEEENYNRCVSNLEEKSKTFNTHEFSKQVCNVIKGCI